MLPVELPTLAVRRAARLRRWLIAVGVVTWTVAVGHGFSTLFVYGNAPGAPSSPPERWPADVELALACDRPTMLLFAHPRCPCTRATIAELDRLVAASGAGVDVTVLFYADERLGERWARTELWQHAARIPGVRVVEDGHGVVAAAFAARTSGAVVVYGPDGRLCFHGGLTASRGHEGDNAGVAAVAALATANECSTCTTPVFGCALVEVVDDAERDQEQRP